MKSMKEIREFPSPTGVNHYESPKVLFRKYRKKHRFRPLQGLTIMNIRCQELKDFTAESFRPLQGLTIMNVPLYLNGCPNNMVFPSPTGVNHYESFTGIICHFLCYFGFRPLQGLTIMNRI